MKILAPKIGSCNIRSEIIDDVERIINVLSIYGYKLFTESAHNIWLTYSRKVGKTWEVLPNSDSDLVNIILDHSDVVYVEN
jgi:hypothetical protein